MTNQGLVNWNLEKTESVIIQISGLGNYEDEGGIYCVIIYKGEAYLGRGVHRFKWCLMSLGSLFYLKCKRIVSVLKVLAYGKEYINH